MTLPPPVGPVPQLSLVVCTRNRLDRLETLLASIDAADRPAGFELVLVDNGSSDGTRQRCWAQRAAASYTVVVVDEPHVGLGRARNTGWRAASGRLVAFTDDDCVLPPDHLVRLCQLFDDLGADFVGGAILAPDGRHCQARVALLEATQPRHFAAGSLVRPGELQGANLAFRRTVLVRIGGFHPALGAGTPFRCEDIECCARALAAGFQGAYVPDLRVVHAHGRSARAARELEAANDRARGAFYAARLARRDWRYAPAWAATLASRCGWRPRSQWRALVIAASELSGALSYLVAARMRARNTSRPR